MLLRTDQFTVSNRDFVCYLRSCKGLPKLFQSHVVLCVAWKTLRLCLWARGSFAISAARCMTSPGSRVGARRLFVAGSALRWKAPLRCWFCDVTAFTKFWIRLDSLSQPMLRRDVRLQLPDCQRAASWGTRIRFGPTHRRLFESECLCGAEPCLAQFLWPCLHHLIFNSSHERYPYRPLYVL